jgi:MYXO-CTERM domain-containing protein
MPGKRPPVGYDLPVRRTSLASAALLAAGLFVSPIASANSRFPESNQILFPATDPDLVFLRVTFGLLVSHDRGKTFDWVCEQSLGISGVEDPMYTVTPSQTYIGSTFSGVIISRDKACSWGNVPEVAGGVFIDLAANPNDPKDIFVFDSAYKGQSADAAVTFFRSQVWETKDEGASWSVIGPPLEETLLGYTIDATKTDPDRLYLTAIRNPGPTPSGFVITSRDRGKTWTEEPVPFENGERSIFIAGVDPTNADRVFLRTLNNTDKPTRLILREAVDGGQPTFRTIFQAQAGLLGFTFSLEGDKIYIGGPKDGIHAASTADLAFEKRSALETQCLGVNADGLWACSTERSGFIAGLSKDEGRTFTAQLHFCDIRGALACPDDSKTRQQCVTAWPAQRALLGCVQVDAGTDAGALAVRSKPDSGGCGCQTTPAGPWGALAAMAGAAIAVVRRVRRRRA